MTSMKIGLVRILTFEDAPISEFRFVERPALSALYWLLDNNHLVPETLRGYRVYFTQTLRLGAGVYYPDLYGESVHRDALIEYVYWNYWSKRWTKSRAFFNPIKLPFGEMDLLAIPLS